MILLLVSIYAGTAQQGKVKNYQEVSDVTLLIWEATRMKVEMIWNHDKCARWPLKLGDC